MDDSIAALNNHHVSKGSSDYAQLPLLRLPSDCASPLSFVGLCSVLQLIVLVLAPTATLTDLI